MRLASALNLGYKACELARFKALGAGDEARETVAHGRVNQVDRVSKPSVRAMRLAR